MTASFEFTAGAILMCLVAGARSVDDFDDHSYGGYEIIYHGNYDLLLAIHGNNCYFVHAPDSIENELTDVRTKVSPIKHTEASLLYHIWSNKNGEVTSSSLSAVRDKYGDLLADFRCQDKHIFEVDFFHPTSTSAHSSPSTATIPSTTSTTNGGGHRVTCQGLGSGLHPHPSDCHKFLVCANGMTFIEPCAPGTAFHPIRLKCVFNNEVPGCPPL